MVEPEQGADSIAPEEASRKLDAALKNVPAEEREPIRRVFQSIERSFQAPYPPPEMIPEYERCYPNFLKTLVDRSYEAQQHTQDMERLSIEGPLKYAQRGQVLGALIVLGGIGEGDRVRRLRAGGHRSDTWPRRSSSDSRPYGPQSTCRGVRKQIQDCIHGRGADAPSETTPSLQPELISPLLRPALVPMWRKQGGAAATVVQPF